jgi:predicted metal-dependent hydrolase
VIDESGGEVRLAGVVVRYVLRRSPRSRGTRLTIDDRRGLVVSVPPRERRGWAQVDGRVEAFIREREAWIVRHLRRLDRNRAEATARGAAGDGGLVLYRGETHKIRVVPGLPGTRRSTVERIGAEDGDELVVAIAPRDRRTVARVLEAWFRERAEEAISRAVGAHAEPLRAVPSEIALRDPRTRWGSASKQGRLMFSWRLVLAPPDALETVVVHELAHLRVFGHGPGFWKLVASRRASHLADRAWLRRHSFALHGALQEPRGAGVPEAGTFEERRSAG